MKWCWILISCTLLTLTALATFLIFEIRETRVLGRRLSTIKVLSADEIRELRQYLNPVHLKVAAEKGVLINTAEDIDRNIANGVFIPFEHNPGYELTTLNNSHPYLTPTANQTLKTIGKRFSEALVERGLPRYTFYVTSVLRTEADQRVLREQKNPNASLLTGHRYGTTIDIYYGDYLYRDLFFSKTWRFFHRLAKKHIWGDEIDKRLPAWNYQQLAFKHGDKIKAILGRLLIEMQDEGALLVIHEKQVPVFHVTLVQ